MCKIESQFNKQNHSLFESIYVVHENQIATVACVNKHLITIRPKSYGYVLFAVTKLVWEYPKKSKVIKYLYISPSVSYFANDTLLIARVQLALGKIP